MQSLPVEVAVDADLSGRPFSPAGTDAEHSSAEADPDFEPRRLPEDDGAFVDRYEGTAPQYVADPYDLTVIYGRVAAFSRDQDGRNPGHLVGQARGQLPPPRRVARRRSRGGGPGNLPRGRLIGTTG